MRILFPAVSVSDLETSLAYYEAIGMEAVGRVSHASTRMAMLALPREDEVSLELVERTDVGQVSAGGLDHLAIQVDDLENTRRELLAAGLDPGVVERPGGADGPRHDNARRPRRPPSRAGAVAGRPPRGHDARRLRRPD